MQIGHAAQVNVQFRGVVLAQGPEISLDLLPEEFQAENSLPAVAMLPPGTDLGRAMARYERQLIKSLCGKTVPSGGIPPMIGVAVLNVATCAAIAEAVILEQPLTHRVVTVTGPAIAKPGNYYAPIGLEVGKLIELCGGLTEETAKVVMGGPMMGIAIADMSTPTTKTTGAITLLGKKEITAAKYDRRQTPCIRCGRCLEVCPENLNPTKIANAVKYNLLEVAVENQIGACMECGCCSYVCPANIEVTGYIKTGKLLLANAKKK